MKKLVIAFGLALSIGVVLNATFTALCGTGASCAYVAGDKFGYQTVDRIRTNFNHLIAPQYWVGAADSGLTGEKNLGALATGLVINTAGVPSAYAGSACTGQVATAISASGVVTCVTRLDKIAWETAICQNATASTSWSLPTSNPAVAACITGTNTQKGVMDFADSANLSMQRTYRLPSDWTSTVDLTFLWLTTATTGDVVWQAATICAADAETDDPAFNTASTVTDTAKGTTNQLNTASITTLTVTGCAAGELLHLKIFRDSAHASDTLAATARLVSVELTIRRTM
jgi:hypothetical protein